MYEWKNTNDFFNGIICVKLFTRLKPALNCASIIFIPYFKTKKRGDHFGKHLVEGVQFYDVLFCLPTLDFQIFRCLYFRTANQPTVVSFRFAIYTYPCSSFNCSDMELE